MEEQHRLDFESSLADIQLLGTPEQIETTVDFIRQFASNGGAAIDPVLSMLRDDLRSELGLPKDIPSSLIFRFVRDEDK